MPEWRIYYGDGSVTAGRTAEEWRAAPGADVQVVVLMEAPASPRWTYDGVPVRDRQLWTGDDSFDPFGWGAKAGAWMTDEDYAATWRRACGDN